MQKYRNRAGGPGPQLPGRAEPPRHEVTPALDLGPRLLYRDALMLVIDKPAGIAVHAGPGGGPNLEAALASLRFGLPRPPELAHRLDRDTSGCLVLGRQRKGLARLGELFAGGLVEKVYWAVVADGPAEDSGRIDLPLAKVPAGHGWRIEPGTEGRPAVTDWQVLGRAPGMTWLALMPRTGRTHQLRVHLLALGFPILGDTLYGGGQAEGLHLHARHVQVPLYPSRDPVAATAPPPEHMREALRACGWREEEEPKAAASG